MRTSTFSALREYLAMLCQRCLVDGRKAPTPPPANAVKPDPPPAPPRSVLLDEAFENLRRLALSTREEANSLSGELAALRTELQAAQQRASAQLQRAIRARLLVREAFMAGTRATLDGERAYQEWLRTRQDVPLREEIDSLKASNNQLRANLEVTEGLLADRQRVLDAYPCPVHGACVPYVLEQLARLQALAAEHGSMVTALAKVARLKVCLDEDAGPCRFDSRPACQSHDAPIPGKEADAILSARAALAALAPQPSDHTKGAKG